MPPLCGEDVTMAFFTGLPLREVPTVGPYERPNPIYASVVGPNWYRARLLIHQLVSVAGREVSQTKKSYSHLVSRRDDVKPGAPGALHTSPGVSYNPRAFFCLVILRSRITYLLYTSFQLATSSPL